MKKYIRLVLAVAILGGIGSFWLLGQSSADGPDSKPGNQIYLPLLMRDDNAPNANNITVNHSQIVPAQTGAEGTRIDGFTFFIPFAAEAMAAQFHDASTDPVVTSDLDIITTISIAVNWDGAVIYYDQWEDGLEPDLTAPTQSTTLVWGDGDPSNNSTGLAPGVQAQGIPANDILTAGTVITLRNTVPSTSAGRGTPPTIFFDGGDMLTSIGGAIAVSATFWTAPPGPGILYTDAWELYPTNRWGTDYVVPIGEDLAGTGLNQRLGFTVVGLNVQAVENGTQVEVDLNNDGTPEQTVILNQGEQLSMTSGVLVGTRVHATAPVQVHLFASNPDSRYEARGYTLVPFEQWSNDYLAPRASDGDFWLYNPNNSLLTVTVQSVTNTTTLSIPANSVVRYPVVPPPYDDTRMSGATGLHFTSNGPNFYGLAALDSADAQDWGYALLPVRLLDSQTLVGLGLGNNNIPPGPGNGGDGFESRVYVTAVSNTTIRVDYNNDGNVDAAFPVSALQEVAITDPNDFDMTGAFLFADRTPFAVVWGQDASANPALPSIDAGTGIVPLPSLLLQKTAKPQDRDCTGTVTLSDTIKFKLAFFNNSINTIRNVLIEDALPPQVTYVPQSTQLNGVPGSILDNNSGSAFPLDEGGFNTSDLASRQSGFIVFDTIVSDGSTSPITNTAEASSQDVLLGKDRVEITVQPQPAPPLLRLSKTLINPTSGFVTSGQVITFGLTITNTSSTTQTEIRLQDTFDGNLLTFLSANPLPDLSATGVITWNNLVATLNRPLLPGATFGITMSFVVRPLPPTIPDTTNVASIVEAQGNNTRLPVACSDDATVQFFAAEPAIKIKKYTNGFDADDPSQDRIPNIAPGQVVIWTYVVSNTGNVPLANVTVTDDQGVIPIYVGGDTNNDGLLDLTETWLFQAIGVAEDLPNSNRPNLCINKAPIYRNKGVATGDYRTTPVSAEDLSHYCPPSTSTPTPTRSCCDGKVTVTPPTQPPPPTGTPVVTGTVFPVAFLPETGSKEAYSDKWAFIGGILLILAAIPAAVNYLGKKRR